MTKTIQILCDACGADLTETDSQPKHRLTLASERMPHARSVTGINAVLIRPHFDGEKNFCDLRCLHDWLKVQPQRV